MTLTSALCFYNSKPTDPKIGDTILLVDTNKIVTYSGSNWIEIAAMDDISIESKPTIRATITHCPCCGAPVDYYKFICAWCNVPYPID